MCSFIVQFLHLQMLTSFLCGTPWHKAMKNPQIQLYARILLISIFPRQEKLINILKLLKSNYRETWLCFLRLRVTGIRKNGLLVYSLRPNQASIIASNNSRRSYVINDLTCSLVKWERYSDTMRKCKDGKYITLQWLQYACR